MLSPLGLVLSALINQLVDQDHPAWADVENIQVEMSGLAPAFDGYQIAQISDFHIGTWINRERLVQAIETVNSLQPDLVAITGDFVTYAPEQFSDDLVFALKKIKARDRVVAILGNHDHWTNPAIIRDVLRKARIIDLSNRVESIERAGQFLHIAGVDDYVESLDRLSDVLEALKPNGPAVLLAHEPDFAKISAPTGRFGLQLSGHSHGGQIVLPWIGAPFLPKFSRIYPRGRYQVENMVLYTNRGLGTGEIQLRLNCPPEITLFTLTNSDPDSF